ncbi:MAG: hypothetical protein R6W66_10490 [Pelovirga sp.]
MTPTQQEAILFEELRQVIREKQQEENFPEWLTEEILLIGNHPEAYLDRQPLVTLLIGQLRDFDPYAGCGCFSASCSVTDIERTLQRLTAAECAEHQ